MARAKPPRQNGVSWMMPPPLAGGPDGGFVGGGVGFEGGDAGGWEGFGASATAGGAAVFAVSAGLAVSAAFAVSVAVGVGGLTAAAVSGGFVAVAAGVVSACFGALVFAAAVAVAVDAVELGSELPFERKTMPATTAPSATTPPMM